MIVDRNLNDGNTNKIMNTIRTNQDRIDRATANCSWKVSLEDKLGEGSFGIVYQASLTEGTKNRKVAIKQVKNTGHRIYIESLRAELDVLNSLKNRPHQNLVALIQHAQIEDDATWIVMENCDLGELKGYLHKNKKHLQLEADVGAINSKSLCTWAVEISKGMAYLGECEIMHGDLAARNVLLTTKNNGHPIAKIADFGMAKSFHEYVYRPWTNITF